MIQVIRMVLQTVSVIIPVESIFKKSEERCIHQACALQV